MKPKSQVRLLDETAVRHRRLQLGLTESYLGSLCGVSSSVIRRLESGWPQDDLSARFITLLADRLGCTTADLLAAPHTDPAADGSPADCRELGAVLQAADEPVPTDALCEVFGWDLDRLEAATVALARQLEAAGAAIVDDGGALRIADDLAACDRDTVDLAARAAFGRRRPNLPELRVVHQLLTSKRVRREDLDTVNGMTHARLRTIGILANAERPAGVKADPPRLSDDVRYSLLLDVPDVSNEKG